ncbi:type I restriction enzyme subunit R domain-containing protein [Myroides odoratus]
MCVQDIDAVIQYYEIFKRKKQDGEHDLKIATILVLLKMKMRWKSKL